MVLTFSDGYASDLFEGAGAILSYAGLGLILVLAGYFAVDLATPGHLTTIIRNDRNKNATLLAVCGMAAVGLIVVASIYASSGDLLEGLIATALWGAIGIAGQIAACTIFRMLLGIDTAVLMRKAAIEPAAVLFGAMQVTIGAVTAISVI